EPGGGPRADAAAARHELADRLLHPACPDRLLVLAGSGLSLHERLAEEARHLVARDRPRRLERRRRKESEIECIVLAWVAVEQAGECAGSRDPAEKRPEDDGVGAVRLGRCRLLRRFGDDG